MLEFSGESLVHVTARRVVEAGFDETIVVFGRDADELAAALADLPVRCVVNSNYAAGQGSSLAAGIAAVSPSMTAAVIALADRPLVTPDIYRTICDHYRRAHPAIVAARFGAIVAPPHLFDRQLFPALLAQTEGARTVIQAHPTRTHFIDFPEPALLDVDTPTDYNDALAKFAT